MQGLHYIPPNIYQTSLSSFQPYVLYTSAVPLLAPVIFEILPRFKNRGILKWGQKGPLLASVITRSHRSLFYLGCRETEAIDSIFFLTKIKFAASAKLPHAPTMAVHVPPLPVATTSPSSLQRATTATSYPIEPPWASCLHNSWTITTALAATAAFKTPLTLHHGSSEPEPSRRNSCNSETVVKTRTFHICTASNLSAMQPRIISLLPSPSRVHLHAATTTIEDATSPPSFPLQRRRELYLCTSNQIRDHHGSSRDVSSIAAVNQNSANSNHASTHQRREFSHRSSVLHLAGSTHREYFAQSTKQWGENWGLHRENWGRRWIVIGVSDLGILTHSMASVEGDPMPKGVALMKFIN